MIWLLMMAIGVIGANSLLLSPIASDVAASFAGADAADIMITSSIYGAGVAVSALTLAPRADRIGLGRALLLAMLLLSMALSLSMAAPTVLILIIAQAMAGIAAGVALPAIYGLAAEIAPEGQESQTLGKILTGWTLSLVAGVAIAAVISDWGHWRAVFGVLAIITCILGWMMRSSGLTKPNAQKGSLSAPLTALRIAGLPPLLLLVAGYMVAFYGLYAFLGVHLTKSLGQPTALAGLAALVYGAGFGAIAPMDRLIDRYGKTRAAPVVFSLLMIIYASLAVVSGSASFLIMICLIWGAANHLGLNILVASLTAIAPGQRGAILGLYSAVTYTSMFAGTAVFKPVFEMHGFGFAACLSALCILPAAAYAFAKLNGQSGVELPK